MFDDKRSSINFSTGQLACTRQYNETYDVTIGKNFPTIRNLVS